MLGWVLLGLVISGVASVIISISFLDKASAQEELNNKRIKKAIVRDIVKDPDVTHIKLDGLDEDENEVEIQFDAEDYDSNEIESGMVICV